MSVLRTVESIRVTSSLSNIGHECLGIKSVTYDKQLGSLNLEFEGTDREVIDAMVAIGAGCILIAKGQSTVFIQYQTPCYLKRVGGLLPIDTLTLPLMSVYIGDIADVL